MSNVFVMIHAVWGTKNREHYINKDVRPLILSHIRENAKSKGIHIDTINARPEHIHCLFSLNADMALSKAINLLKGESSHWVNIQKIINFKFEWAGEYFAESVSKSQMEKVRFYILNQDEHHKKVSFSEECDRFLENYAFEHQG